MTSQSHRNHRTTRWNILQTVTTDRGLRACLCVCLITGLLTPCVADDQSTLQQSRSLLRSLRTGQPIVQPEADKQTGAPEEDAPAVVQVSQTEDPEGMQLNDVFFSVGEHDPVGAVEISDHQPPPNPVSTISRSRILPPQAKHTPRKSRSHQPRVKRFFGIDGTAVKKNLKKGTTKIRNQAIRLSSPFIEYEADYSVDDYHMPILLVAAQEEIEEQPEDEGSALLSRKLTDIEPTLTYAWGNLPESQLPDNFHARMDNGPYVPKTPPRTVVQWAPTNLWYYPLYFEDVGLERYGHSHKPWIQPFLSTGRFMGQVVGLPYQMTLHPPHCREYALGYYQPGEWAPKKKYQVPWNEEAAATEFLWVAGFILLIP